MYFRHSVPTTDPIGDYHVKCISWTAARYGGCGRSSICLNSLPDVTVDHSPTEALHDQGVSAKKHECAPREAGIKSSSRLRWSTSEQVSLILEHIIPSVWHISIHAQRMLITWTSVTGTFSTTCILHECNKRDKRNRRHHCPSAAHHSIPSTQSTKKSTRKSYNTFHHPASTILSCTIAPT